MNTPLKIFNSNFTMLGEIDDYDELLFINRLTTYGEFEITMNNTKHNASLLVHGNMIYLDEQRSGIIEHIEITYENGYEEIIVTGFSLLYSLTKRVTFPFASGEIWEMTGSYEKVIKGIVSYNLGNDCLNTKRMNTRMIIMPNLNRGSIVTYKSDFERLDEAVSKLAKMSSLGVKMGMNVGTKNYVFDVYQGRNLSADQSLYPPVIFSTENENLIEQQYVYSTITNKNCAVVVSKGEGAERKVIVVNDNLIGENRREIFVPCKSIDKTETEKLSLEGEQKLLEKPIIQTLEGSINPYNAVKPYEAYGLGDIVTMKYKDLKLNTQITEIKEEWSIKLGYSIECTFGNKIPTLIDKIKAEIKG